MTPREINFQETQRSIIGNPFCALESVNKFAARNESRICLHFIESDTSQTSDSERSRKLNKFIELAARHMFPYVNLIRKKVERITKDIIIISPSPRNSRLMKGLLKLSETLNIPCVCQHHRQSEK
jgi:hypothetical protein